MQYGEFLWLFATIGINEKSYDAPLELQSDLAAESRLAQIALVQFCHFVVIG